MWVHDLRDADASCGGKALGLAKLIAAGLDVPPGFVLSNAAFRADAIPPEVERDVLTRAAELGSLLAVRSSTTLEDGATGAAAGVFSSQIAVPPAEVWDAIRAVWASASTPLAEAYAHQRGGTLGIGVIIQAYVPGTPIVVYTRPPGRPDSPELLIQRDGRVSRHDREDLPREIEAQHAALIALRAELALGVTTGVDVELVQLRKQSGFDVAIETVLVQARPIIHPAPRRALVPPPPLVLAPLQDGRTWHWDITHNPDPLSPAQQGLVERVEAAGLAPWSLRLCAGFLYSASRNEPAVAAPASCAELEARARPLETQLEKILDADDALPVADAIERYLAFYAIWARELSPLIAAARRVLPATLHAHGIDNPELVAARLVGPRRSAVEACLFAAARGERDERDVMRELGHLSPAWDVAVETYAERAGLLADAIDRARRALAMQSAKSAEQTLALDSAALDAAFGATKIAGPGYAIEVSATTPAALCATLTTAGVTRDISDEVTRDISAGVTGGVTGDISVGVTRDISGEVAIAREAAELAERDDALFARAQWLVRRALLERARAAGIAAADFFWLPLDEAASSAPIDPIDAQRRAAGARAAAARAANWQMPLIVAAHSANDATDPAVAREDDDEDREMRTGAARPTREAPPETAVKTLFKRGADNATNETAAREHDDREIPTGGGANRLGAPEAAPGTAAKTLFKRGADNTTTQRAAREHDDREVGTGAPDPAAAVKTLFKRGAEGGSDPAAASMDGAGGGRERVTDGGGAGAGERVTLRGVGSGPRVVGRVVRFASLASAVAVGAGDVIVARSITPALAVVVAGCAAIVSETGGYLDHGAALARELGIPCVVGCRDAWSLLADGMLVMVDGDGGTVSVT